MLTAFTALAAFSGCAAARRYLERHPAYVRRETELLGGRVRLKALWNGGAAFGLPIPGEVLRLGSAAALGAVWAVRQRCCPAGAGLILGGGLSNLCERLLWGRVYDYIQLPKAPGPLRRYVFNLADLAILAGGALCLAFTVCADGAGRRGFC